MEPSAAERLTIVSLETLAEWAGLSNAPIVDPVGIGPPALSPLASLLQHLGFPGQGATHYRVLAAVDATAFAAAIGGVAPWLLGGAPPNLAELGQANLIHTTARRLCDMEPWPGVAAAAAAAAMNVAAAPAAVAPLPMITSVKLAQLIDQTLDVEVPFLPDPQVLVMHARCLTAMGEAPHIDVDCTEEQLSALHHLIQSGRAPYTDFSLFGPHGTRLLLRLLLKGPSLDSSGTFRNIKLYGPSDVDLWTSCWDVFSTAAIMLDFVQRSTLMQYSRKILHYAKR